MPGLTGASNQSPRLTTGFLNTQNDPTPGAVLTSPSGSIVQPYSGMLGSKLFLSADDAARLSLSTTGVLYGGVYQYVQFAAAAANLAIGRLCFWNTAVAENLYQVTTLESGNGGVPLFAGVLVSAPTAGNYGWIQIAGRATVQCKAVVTAATRLISWAAAGAGADNATVDGLASATAVTQGTAANLIGIAEAVAANAALIIVDMSASNFKVRQ